MVLISCSIFAPFDHQPNWARTKEGLALNLEVSGLAVVKVYITVSPVTKKKGVVIQMGPILGWDGNLMQIYVYIYIYGSFKGFPEVK